MAGSYDEGAGTMKLTSIKGAIVSQLRSSLPQVKIKAMEELQKAFKPPAFFIQMIPYGLSKTNKYHTAKSIFIDIHYFPEHETEIECLEMADLLLEVFDLTLKVEDRNLLLEDIQSEIDDNVLHFTFDLRFTDSADGVVIINDVGTSVVVPKQDIEPELGYEEISLEIMRDLHVKED